MGRSYRDLIAWQKAMSLAESVYAVSSQFPTDERYGMTAQIRRCAVSIASNIAEGHGRLTTKDWQHFLSQARGSANELETQLLLSIRLRLAPQGSLERVLTDAEEVDRVINGLLNSTRSRPPRKNLE